MTRVMGVIRMRSQIDMRKRCWVIDHLAVERKQLSLCCALEAICLFTYRRRGPLTRQQTSKVRRYEIHRWLKLGSDEFLRDESIDVRRSINQRLGQNGDVSCTYNRSAASEQENRTSGCGRAV